MSIWCKKCKVAIIIIVLLFNCIGCTKEETEIQKAKEMDAEGYPYANSTDIFSAEDSCLYAYDVDGINKRKLEVTIPENGLLGASDQWLYYKEELKRSDYYLEEIRAVYRIPLKKGKDGRSIIAGKAEKITDALEGVTVATIVADDYLVYIRPSSCVSWYSAQSGFDTLQNVDEIFTLDLRKGKLQKSTVEREEGDYELYGDWKVVGYSKSGIIWKGDFLFYQDIYKNEITVINQGYDLEAVYNPLQKEVYYIKDNGKQEITSYNIETKQSKVLIKRKEYISVVEEYSGILFSEAKKISLDFLYFYKDKVYLTVKLRTRGNLVRYMLLSYHAKKRSLLYELELDSVGHLYTTLAEMNEVPNMLGCVDEKWFFMKEKRVWKFNRKTKKIELCDLDKSGNEIWAIMDKKELKSGVYGE